MDTTLAAARLPDALVLNADHRPLGVCGWQEAIQSVMRGRAYAVAVRAVRVRSPSQDFELPSVMALRRHVPTWRQAAFTRANVWLAYAEPAEGSPKWTCALCGEDARAEDLTFDHVVPRSKGGVSSWENICLAHSGCNQRKGDRTLAQAGMRLRVALLRPTEADLAMARVRLSASPAEEAWMAYLPEPYWRVTLES